MTYLSTTNSMSDGRDVLTSSAHPGFDEPDLQEKTEQLDRILKSRTLQNSESLKALLQYIAAKGIEDEDHEIRGNTIAAEVFGRSNFNPSLDSLVRVHTKRLRERLREYYQTEGKSDKVVIDIPKGHYNTVFSYGRADELQLDPAVYSAPLSRIAPPGQTGSQSRSNLLRNALLGATVVLLIAMAVLWYWNKALRREGTAPVSASTARIGGVWGRFIGTGSPTLVVLSNPPVFRFSNRSDPPAVIKKAVKMSPEQSSRMEQVLKDMVEAHQPRKSLLAFAPIEYTGMGEAIGLYRVAELLASAGTDVKFKQSRILSADDLKTNNVVMLGSVSVNVWSGKIPVKEELTYLTNATIHNNRPLPGEEEEYRPRFDERTGELIEDYALITVRPGVTDEQTFMVLAGIESEGTQAAAEFLTSKESLDIMNQRLSQADDGKAPIYYQALLKVGVENGIPTTVTVVTIHPLRVTRG